MQVQVGMEDIDQNPLPGRTALILYGSETGNAQDIAEELGRLAQRLRFSTRVSDLDSVELLCQRQLPRASLVLIAVSTTGQGDLPANARSLWRSLRSVRLRPGCLRTMRFAMFGLGDSSYLQFNWASRKLHNRLVQLGAQSILERGEADEQHPEGAEGSFVPWSIKLQDALLQQYPLPADVKPLPANMLLQPKWALQFEGDPVVENILKDQPHHRPPDDDIPDTATQRRSDEELPADNVFPIPETFIATVLKNDRVTPSSHWQDVRHLSFSTPSSAYNPGDVLVIYPKNFPADVDSFLALMSWNEIADRPLKLQPTLSSTLPDDYPPPPIPLLKSHHVLTLRSLLTNALDINSIPRRSFFSLLAHYTDDPYHRERLLEFTQIEYLDELYDYTTRPRRSIHEVLQEFDSVRIPWQHACTVLPRLRGRQFSIASGGRLKEAPTAVRNGVSGGDKSSGAQLSPRPATEGRVELLVAIVKYRTVIKRIRQGVCTRYIASLRPGQRLAVALQRGALGASGADAADISKPVVMVGPGTGVAPIRSIVYERVAAAEAGMSWDAAKDILIFGCRNESADFFFRDEWEQLSGNEWHGEVVTAFSRDQRIKVYVQDVIRQRAVDIYNALAKKDGHVYICGSSGKMPQAVREALIEVFQGQGLLDRQKAEQYLVGMEKSGRYKQETW